MTLIRLHIFAALLAGTFALKAADIAVDFDRDIRPILSENCFFCHGPDEKKRKGKLRLDVKTPTHSEVIVPGKPDASELIRRISSPDADEVMPRRSRWPPGRRNCCGPG